jgi:hypothetical protein
MKTLFLTIITLSFSFSISAECKWYDITDCRISLYIDGWSVHHVDNNNKYNESQDTKGVRIDQFNIISFKNSFGKPGQAFFVNAPLSDEKFHQLGLLFTLLYGYKDHPIPALLPYMQIKYKTLAVNVSCLPAIDGTNQFICGFILEVKIQ